MNRGRGEEQNSQPAREFFRWTDDMDSRLIDALIEEARLGNRVDGTWTTQAYTNIVQALRNAGVADVTKNHVKNRLKTLKDKWREVHDLFKGTSGFAYSPLTKRFEAKDRVWDELIRAKPSTAKWRCSQVKHYDLLEELYGSDRATRTMGSTARQVHRGFNVDHLNINLNDTFEADMSPNFRGFDDSQDSPCNVDSYSAGCSQSVPSGGTSTSRGTKRKSPMSDFMEAQLKKLTCGLDKVADAIISGNALS